MAKLKRRESNLREKTESAGQRSTVDYSDWLPEQKRMISVEDLEFYPDNWSLVGRLAPGKRATLKEDILHNGLREPLHVWLKNETLIVVSGNERLDIVRDLSAGERGERRLNFLPCILKDFKSDAEARNHVITVNENRKTVKLPPVDRVIALFPLEENPLLYADFRGKHTSESVTDRIKSPGGDIILEKPVYVHLLMDQQRQLRDALRKITGWSERFTEKTVAAASKKLRDIAGVEVPVAYDPALVAEAKKAGARAESLRTKIRTGEDKIGKLKEDLAKLRIELRKQERILLKASKAGVI